jgi:hypothetical protein
MLLFQFWAINNTKNKVKMKGTRENGGLKINFSILSKEMIKNPSFISRYVSNVPYCQISSHSDE